MSATELLAPIVEEIANRWGFFGFTIEEPAQPLTLSARAIEGYRFYGRSLTLADLAAQLPGPVEATDEMLELPLLIPSSDLDHWRRTARAMFDLLAQENPQRLGREETRVWEKPRTPNDSFENALTLSDQFLQRTYRGNFLVKEKKAVVADYRRSQNNYLASVDSDGDVPSVLLLDASSQIASHLLGFNGTSLQGVTAHPESFQNLDYREEDVPGEAALRALLLRWAPPGLDHIAWCNSGTEAWEKALHMAALKFPERGKKCVCFKGSFHGRTMLSLFSSWNPAKRLPFEIDGFQTLWAEFPEDKEPHLIKDADSDWLARWEDSGRPDFCPPEVNAEENPLLAAEVESLMQVRAHLITGEVNAVSIEPMQCEGGDRFGSNRLFQTLRVLTHAMGVALIFDEVQTGFGLGGHRLWSNSFGLRDSQGNPLPPDFITLAKKCQVGAVLSATPDPYPTTAHAASFMRGYINAASVYEDVLTALGDKVRERLFALAKEFPIISYPRAAGVAFAFDLPDAEHANNFVNQRFHHGFMVYIAGEVTLRFRIQRATRARDLDYIFEAITASLRHLMEQGPKAMPTRYERVWPAQEAPPFRVPAGLDELENTDWAGIMRWYCELLPERFAEVAEMLEPDPERNFPGHHFAQRLTWLEFVRYMSARHTVRIRPMNEENWADYKDAIMALEEANFEPARMDDEEFLRRAVCADGAICSVALEGEKLVGFQITAPLEEFPQVIGPDKDPVRGDGTHLYSADILVSADCRGQGVGLRLKRRQVLRARNNGYHAIRSRNRVGAASAMSSINRSFGAVECDYFPECYGEDKAPCIYYSAPLYDRVVPLLNWSAGVESPTGGLLDKSAWTDWDLAAVNKNSLCNWWTPNMTRYVEWLRSAAPLGHLYLASGRDEAVDKLVKCLIYFRKGAQTMISFEGSFWGGVTACARSLSDPAYSTYFPWHHLPYPYTKGDPFIDQDGELTPAETSCLEQLWSLMAWKDKLLGVAVEPVQQMTGRRLSVRFLKALRRVCDETGVPLVMNESASWAYRGSRELFYCQATGVLPDLLTMFGGGQVGHVLTNDKYYLDKPLMMISTWDGDELSCLRLREQIRILRAFRDDPRLYEIDRKVGAGGDTFRGSGVLYGKQYTLAAAPTLDGQGQLLFCPLNRLSEGWDALMTVLGAQQLQEA
jgi:4-aminobutyrate aminotransferase-like enzyme/GNAT superfamily N-acetyltransferase